MRYPMIIVITAVLSGCSGDIVVYHGDQQIRGIPFNTMESWAFSQRYTQLKAGGSCKKEISGFTEMKRLATGDDYYIAPVTSAFAITKFAVVMSEGALTQVTLDSEPSAELIKAPADVISTLVGAAATAKGAMGMTTEKKTADDKPCDTSPEVVKIQPWQEYLKEVNRH